MKVALLTLHCLNAVADDYESLESITADVRRATHGDVSPDDVAACLSDLARDALIGVFAFDREARRYVPLAGVPTTLADKWFSITAQGLNELQTNWVEQ
jgi:hypothetical protein